MSISCLPLGYCTNVHSAQTVAGVLANLDRFTVPVGQNLRRPIAAGLWLPRSVASELVTGQGVARFRVELEHRGLTCHTLNAFPYGDFHRSRVKEDVYFPDWADPARLSYTSDCAAVLAGLLPEGGEGSISTVPLGFKGYPHGAKHRAQCLGQLLDLARRLARLRDETGRTIRLAIEPEPMCLLETTAELAGFFGSLWQHAAAEGILESARRHLGACFDVCHQAVEFEDIATSIGTLRESDIRINKVHVTCALELEAPAGNLEARQALAQYAEERYLHQTFAHSADGQVFRHLDLTAELALDPPPEMRDARCWRIHFHVPVDCERLGPLKTTRAELHQALVAIAALDYAPHLEVETYTWPVLPGSRQQLVDQMLIDGLTREMSATHALIREIGANSGKTISPVAFGPAESA